MTAPVRSILVDIVVDCDPGIDDAIALAYLASEQLAGRLCLAGVTTVHGNVDVTMTGRNAAFVLDRLGLDDAPVHQGSADPLTPLGYELDTTAFHGVDGLGGVHDPSHPDRSRPDRVDTDAADGESMDPVLETLATATGAGHALLALGPLTNVASWFRADPCAPGSLEHLVVMGGAFGTPPGNITSMAEFNFHVDGEAASEVMASGSPITLVPLDTTEQVLIGLDDLVHLSGAPGGRMLREMLSFSIRSHRRHTGVEGCFIHDALAAAVLVDPSLAECTTGHVTVTPEGTARGHVDLEPDANGPVRVVLEIDVDRARDQILGSLARI